MRRPIGLNAFAGAILTLLLTASCNKGSAPAPASTATPAAPKPVASAVTTPAPFEGEIQVQVTESPKAAPKSVVYEVKADRVRYEEGSPAASAYTIANLTQKKAYAVADTRKDYVEIDAEPPTQRAGEAVQVKRTGRTEKVAGYDCENWHVSTGKEELDICAAHEIPYFDLVSAAPATAVEPGWAGELTKAKAFPLRLIAHDKSGKEQLRVETTKISRKMVDIARLTVPAGYHKVAMSKDTAVFGIQ